MRSCTIAQCPDASLDGEVVGKNIGAELRDLRVAFKRASGVELGDRDVEGNGLVISAGDGYAHATLRLPPFFSNLIDVPRPAHQHMRDEDQVAREEHETPLAASFDLLDSTTDERGVVVQAGEFCETRFERGDDFTAESFLQSAGGTEDCVTLRHRAPLQQRVPGAQAGCAAR